LTDIAAGDVELELPEGTPDFNSDMNHIRPSAGEPDQDNWVSNSRRTTVEGGLPTVPEGTLDGRTSHGSIKLLDSLTAEELAAAQQQQQMGLQVPAMCSFSWTGMCVHSAYLALMPTHTSCCDSLSCAQAIHCMCAVRILEAYILHVQICMMVPTFMQCYAFAAAGLAVQRQG